MFKNLLVKVVRGEPRAARKWEQCPACDGFGMIQFPDMLPFTDWQRDNLSIEQLRSIGVDCSRCGGRESIPRRSW